MPLVKSEIKKHLRARPPLVEGMIDEAQLQPCGVDLTLKEVHCFAGAGKIDFDNKERKLSACKKIEFKNNKVFLKKGAYKIIYNEIVHIPPELLALGFPRSSLLRCGADVHCAVWDPGYEGRSESLLIVENENGIALKQNAKLMQLVFFRLSEAARELYSGKFKGENIKG